MKNELPLQTLSDVAQAWKAGTLGQAGVVQKKSTSAISAKNTSNTPISTNRPVVVSGFSTSLSYAKAYQKMTAGTLALGVAPASSGNGDVVTLSPIPAGKFGNVSGPIEFGVVNFASSTDEYANADFTSSEDGGAYRIVAKSGTSGTYAVCALLRLSGGGGEVPTFTVTVVNSTTLEIELS